MQRRDRTIILIHGLWDTPRVFNKLAPCLENIGARVLVPHLPHGLGHIPIRTLATHLDQFILETIEEETLVDVIGFSMGGLIARYWLQRMNGIKRTKNFFTIGTPHQGTFTAQFVPAWILSGIADMKRGSLFLEDLNKDVEVLVEVAPVSFYCFWDLMVFPGFQARLHIGESYEIPVLTHKGLINHPRSIDILVKEILGKIEIGIN